MTFDVLSDLNWVAVVVAAFAYFMLGALWYAPFVFGKAWMGAIGWDPSVQPQMNPADYAKPLVTDVVISIVIGMLAIATATDTLAEGLVLGIILGVGLVMTVVYVTASFDPKSPKPMVWAGVTGGYHAVGFLITSVLHAVL